MNKYVLTLSAALAVCVVIAVMYARDLERERTRANALEERVFELEPIEKNGSSTRANADPHGYDRSDLKVEPAAEPAVVHADADADGEPAKPKSVMEYSGSLVARRFVQRLQTALASGTPLEDYQIRHLIVAVDDVRSTTGEMSMQDRGGQGGVHARIIQRANEILFESQMDVLLALLEGDLHEDASAISETR